MPAFINLFLEKDMTPGFRYVNCPKLNQQLKEYLTNYFVPYQYYNFSIWSSKRPFHECIIEVQNTVTVWFYFETMKALYRETFMDNQNLSSNFSISYRDRIVEVRIFLQTPWQPINQQNKNKAWYYFKLWKV